MKITAGILFYLLEKYEGMQHICHGADSMELTRVEHFRNQKETKAGVLYVFADKKGVLLFCSEKEYKASYILMRALKGSNEPYSSLWIPDEKADEVTESIVETWGHFTQMQNEILEDILLQRSSDEILDKVRGLLKAPFILVGNDMLLLYHHTDFSRMMMADFGEKYGEEIVENLLMKKEFHEVAKNREPFYFSLDELGYRVYCFNIYDDDYYLARLVVYAERGEQTLKSGEEQISKYLSEVILQMVHQGVLKTTKTQDNQLHSILQNLLQGYAIEYGELSRAVTKYQWKENESYMLICLQPYMASGWETQVDHTMPTMTRKLEKNWRHSCAVFLEKKILWLINVTLTINDSDSYELFQQLMVLLRENVFRAGASSRFDNIRMIPSALKEAEAALELGTKIEPSYWYYRFDDYRLNYMMDMIQREEIDPMLLVHPAIPALLRHDQTHENELSKTLETLIEKRGNLTQAADTLFIHRTTLFRRLNQIKEMTGIDLENSDQMLELQLSYRILNGLNT